VVWAILEAVIERRTNKRRIQGDSSRPYTHAIFSTPQDNCIHLLRLATHLLPLSRGYPRVFNASYTELPHLTAATHVRQDRAADANTAFSRFHEQESFVFGNDSQTVVTCGTCLGRFAGKILVSLGVQVSEDDSLISAFYWSTIRKAQQGLAAWPRVHVAVYSRLEKCTFHCNEWGQFELNRGGMVGKLRVSRCKLQEVKNTHGSCSAYSTVANRN
jgi:hypothetical protein